MKNKKGMTIAELIVSIVLVSVACIYFFQTIVVVNDLYKSTQEDTNLYLHKLYLLRLADAQSSINASELKKYDLPKECAALIYYNATEKFACGSTYIYFKK